jgi:hypothetical protein
MEKINSPIKKITDYSCTHPSNDKSIYVYGGIIFYEATEESIQTSPVNKQSFRKKISRCNFLNKVFATTCDNKSQEYEVEFESNVSTDIDDIHSPPIKIRKRKKSLDSILDEDRVCIIF